VTHTSPFSLPACFLLTNPSRCLTLPSRHLSTLFFFSPPKWLFRPFSDIRGKKFQLFRRQKGCDVVSNFSVPGLSSALRQLLGRQVFSFGDSASHASWHLFHVRIGLVTSLSNRADIPFFFFFSPPKTTLFTRMSALRPSSLALRHPIRVWNS